MNIHKPYIFKLIEEKMISKLLQTKPEPEPTQEDKEFLARNIRRIEKGLRRNLGYSRQDALMFVRDLRESLRDGENQ